MTNNVKKGTYCTECGAPMKFSQSQGAYVCEFCGAIREAVNPETASAVTFENNINGNNQSINNSYENNINGDNQSINNACENNINGDNQSVNNSYENNQQINNVYGSNFNKNSQSINNSYSNEILSDERSFMELMGKRNAWSTETHMLKCDACGARQVVSKNELVTSCPFCGMTQIVEVQDSSLLRPTSLVPFSLTHDEVIKKVKIWASTRFCVPGAFKKSLNVDHLTGIYLPMFTFDAKTVSKYSGVLYKNEKEYYIKKETVTDADGKKREVETQAYNIVKKEFSISGTFYLDFDDIKVAAASKEDTKIMESVGGIGMETVIPYQAEYLTGYRAEPCERDYKDCFEDAKAKMKNSLKEKIVVQYEHDGVQSLNFNISFSDIKYRYVLIPVYVGYFQYGGKTYNFYVNGVTGKISGHVPQSGLKQLGLVFSCFCGIGFFYIIGKAIWRSFKNS